MTTENKNIGKLSPSFSVSTMIKSQTATKNKFFEQFVPNDFVIENLNELCNELLEPLYMWLMSENSGSVLKVTSGYRCKRLNATVGGSKNSQHVKGEAADIQLFVDGKMQNNEIVSTISELGLEFDQMIWEHGGKWVHISYSKGKNRNQYIET